MVRLNTWKTSKGSSHYSRSGSYPTRQALIERTITASPRSTKILATLSVLGLLFVPFNVQAAISAPTYSAFDNAISRTSVATSGNGAGVVFVAGDDASDSITAVTWNGVSMTKVNTASVEVPGDRYISVWCVSNPASATTIAFNDNTDNYWRNFNAFYPGATCPEDSENGGTSSGSTVISVATTVVDAGSWLIMFQKDGTGGTTYSASGSLTTMRANTDDGGLAIADSNGAVGSGSKTGTLTTGGSINHGAIVFSLAPIASAVQDASYTIIFD